MEEALVKNGKKKPKEVDLGFLLWKLEELSDFLPCYRTIMKYEQK